MVSFKVRQTLKATAKILVLTALAARTAVALGQVANDEQQRQIVEKIEEILARNGPRSPDLVDPLAGLGLLYQESEDHGLAIAAIERAVEIVRVNYGLHSLDQAPLIRQLIHIAELKRDHTAAWELEQELLTLARRHPDDLRIVAILHEIANKRMEELQQYLAGDYPPQILACRYADSGLDPDCTSWSRRELVRVVLTDVREKYANAIGVLLRHELYTSRELRELEVELVRSFDLLRYHAKEFRRTSFHSARAPFPLIGFGSQSPEQTSAVVRLAGQGVPYLPNESALENENRRARQVKSARLKYLEGDHYEVGRLGLVRLLAYDVASSRPAQSRMNAQIQLADWDLLYSRSLKLKESALERYEQAYEGLREEGVHQPGSKKRSRPRHRSCFQHSRPTPWLQVKQTRPPATSM